MCGLASACVCLQEFMQQLLTAIVEQFPHQALWSMAVVVKSTIRTRQVSFLLLPAFTVVM
jgi:hypothetical protein